MASLRHCEPHHNPVLCLFWRSGLGIMKNQWDVFACCIKGFPCLRVTVLYMRHFFQEQEILKTGLDWGIWMQAFFAAPPGDSSLKKKS